MQDALPSKRSFVVVASGVAGSGGAAIAGPRLEIACGRDGTVLPG